MDRRKFIEGISLTALATRFGLTEAGEAWYLNRSVSAEAEHSPKTVHGLIPVPDTIEGIATHIISLNGSWRFSPDPPNAFWTRDLNLSSWHEVPVPSEFSTQGFRIVENVEYPCRRKVHVPAELKDLRLFLRFDGVYGYARVWINGTYIRDHFGGFTSWECEITEHVEAGAEFDLVLGITDRSDDISQASYYAKHSVAGILRKVRMIAVPADHLSKLSVTATLDSHLENGIMIIEAAISSSDVHAAELRLSLTDAGGVKVRLDHDAISFPDSSVRAQQAVLVRSPKLWDAEHPNLYTLEAVFLVNGRPIETIRQRIGFRVVERKGNRLLVNGQPVKLRGVCRHSIHPIDGRAVSPQFDEIDAALFRDANINFIRTSHYPPSEEFLDACDRHGIYVEEETAVCWSNVAGGPSSNPDFASRFSAQFQEMIMRDKDHASVLFWSLGNESQWGDNFRQEYSLAKKYDSTRPLIFSYPDTVPWGTTPYDIYSKHYPEVSSDIGSDLFPVLNDEFAHVSCYNVETLRRDPGVRNFWGESISRFGEKFLTSDGSLGGSIWAGIDEIFFLPNGPVGYGPWGIIDGWRRPKPEYWLTKKAYSPIRIKDHEIVSLFAEGRPQVPVVNAFDHTNLSELTIRWQLGSASGQLAGVDIAPHHEGLLTVPARRSAGDDLLELMFYRVNGSLVDHYKLPLSRQARPVYDIARGNLHLDDGREEVSIQGATFAVVISKATGLISRGTCNNKLILESGPYLDLGKGILEPWLLTSFEVTKEDHCVIVRTTGQYDGGIETISVEFEIRIDEGGLITTRYRIVDRHDRPSHLGICYLLPEDVDTFAWDRLALWSVYPDDHIGRPKGVAKRSGGLRQSYRSKPGGSWSQDTNDYFLYPKDQQPTATNEFRSIKEHVWYGSCILSDGKSRARIEAAGDVAVLASPRPDGHVLLSAYNYWSYPDLVWGNYIGAPEPPAQTIQEIRLRLTSNGES